MSYAGTIDGYRVHRCDVCGTAQVESRGFRAEEAVEFDGRVYAVDLCSGCDEGKAVAWLADRHGTPERGDIIDQEGCPHCRRPSCDCARESERQRWDEKEPPWLRGVA